MRIVNTPLTESVCQELTAGQQVYLNGTLYTARDAAHQRMIAALEEGKGLPFDIRDQVIYYVGPTPAKPGKIIGSAGPTTSGRMDAYAPKLLALGLKGMIGKGFRNQHVVDAIQWHKALYFAATGGCGALLSRQIVKMELVAYEDLGPEAVYKLQVENFPVTVVIDTKGTDLYRAI